MGERWDNLKEEIYWPISQISKWWEESDNRFATWAIVISTSVAALIVYGTVFFGGRAAISYLMEETTITVESSNPCLTNKGLTKSYAPPACYEDKLSHPPKYPTTSSAAETMLNSSKPQTAAVYDPPCAPSVTFLPRGTVPAGKAVGCNDQIYSKRLVEGEIYTATFNGDEKLVDDDHLKPDYTEVQFLALQDDMEAPPNEKFCGNVLDKFTPGKKFRMVINESKQSDYNGCYVIEVVEFTFGGSPYYQHAKRK